MCGICGIVSPVGAAVNPAMLRGMMDAMIHRGPDDAGSWIQGSTALGFRRLAILDPVGGHQPMFGEDGQIVTVTNGEIYNFRELRSELKARGHRFHSESDAEVVPHLYEEWGIAGVTRLRGMFGLAIWDHRRGRVYLVRDHFGIKPLYYAVANRTLYFASEIRGLLASGRLERMVNHRALRHYFSFQYVPDPMTIFEGIHRVPPAHYLMFENGEVTLKRYWQLEFHPDPDASLAEMAARIQTVMRDSVNRHMVSDVPRGAYLSSGIDSSLVVALMREREPVETFSIGFSGKHREINEVVDARETATTLGTSHHEVVIDADRYRDMLPAIVAAQEEPVADPSAPALYFLAQAARRQVTVILSGEGADELFGGYPIYSEPAALAPFECLPATLRAQVGEFAARLPRGMKGRGYLTRGALPLNRRFIGNARIFSEAEKDAFLEPEAGAQPVFDITDPYYQMTAHLDPVARMQMVDCHTWLPGDILMKADKMSMAHSLELRVPFLDVEVFETAAQLPSSLRVGWGTTKVALRHAARGLLPPAVFNRPKLGFPIPIRDWIRGPMRDFVHDVFDSCHPDGVDMAYFSRLLEDRTQYVFNRDRKIWTGMIYSLWHRAYMEQWTHCEPSSGAVVDL